MEPEIYKKDQKYNLIYINNEGKEKEYQIIPEEDMTKPKIIMKCKEDNKDFIKLKEVKKLEEGDNNMEENNINTLADIIKLRGGEGLDIGDSTIDMIVYFEYDGDSNDAYDKCLAEIAKNVKVERLDDEYAVVDLYNYVKEHLSAFEEIFDLAGNDEDEEVANMVEDLEGVFSGFLGDTAYNDLYNALTKKVENKIEEANKKAEYILIPANASQIEKLEKGSAFTWEGMDISPKNLEAIVEYFKKNTPSIKLPINFFTIISHSSCKVFSNICDFNFPLISS